MNTQHMNTTTRLRNRIALVAILVVGLIPIALAHGGEEHVIGTVAKVSATSVTVRTTAGKMVEVGFDSGTTYSQADRPIGKADVKVGDRVVIHAKEVNEKLIAHTVEIGAAAAKKK